MKRVAVGIISRLREDTPEYLLISAKKDFGKYTGFYYPPGDHVEEGETDEIALEREIKEELGVKVRVLEKMSETLGDVKDQITTWWKCSNEGSDFEIQDDEISDIRWMTKKEIEESFKIWPATKKFFMDIV